MNSKLICWDSGVLIALLAGEQRYMQSIHSVIREVQSGRYRLAMSALVYFEMHEDKMSANSRKIFHDFMKNKKMAKTIPVDAGIAKKAQEIRSRNSNMEIPDAIHLATAVASKAGVFHTFDSELLKLNQKWEADGLMITGCTIP